MVEITKLEETFLDTLETCDHSSDGDGIQGFPFDGYGMTSKIFRGVLASLIRKGVVGTEIMESHVLNKNRTKLVAKKDTWVWVNSDFVEKDPTNDWSGRKFINLKVK